MLRDRMAQLPESGRWAGRRSGRRGMTDPFPSVFFTQGGIRLMLSFSDPVCQEPRILWGVRSRSLAFLFPHSTVASQEPPIRPSWPCGDGWLPLGDLAISAIPLCIGLGRFLLWDDIYLVYQAMNGALAVWSEDYARPSFFPVTRFRPAITASNSPCCSPSGCQSPSWPRL